MASSRFRTAVPANRSYTPDVAQGEFGDLGNVGRNGAQPDYVGQCTQRDRARANGAAQQPMPGDGGVEPQQLFPDALSVRVGQPESDVVGQRAQVGDVVVEPFQFDEQGAEPVRIVAQFDAESILDGEAVGNRMRDGGIAADALGQPYRAVGRAALEELFQAPVHEPESSLESQDRFARDGEAEVAWLDQPGVHRAYRDLIHPGPIDRDEREVAGCSFEIRARARRLLRMGYQASGQCA